MSPHHQHARRPAAGARNSDHARDLHVIKRQIQSEFEYLPGLKLTFAQARRLFGLDAECCALVLASLLDEGALTLTTDGAYVRATRAQMRA